MQLKKLPIGIQTFSKIREDNYIYIDKTDMAYELMQNYQYVFLSRPRRFGKSLFLDTLRNIFEGKKEYFKDLAIESKWNWEIKHPVIIINFAKGKIESRADLDKRFEEILEDNEIQLGVKCHSKIYDRRCFDTLIKEAYKKYNQKVVVLVDEYDKPILDNIEKVEIAKEIRDGLVNFYSVIKGSDEFLRFAFLTGVSKFTKTSIFSGLNNISDISLSKKFADICGYSQNDVDTSFAPYLVDADKEKLKKWYNGYNFLGSSMYNPFDILQFIANDFEYKNYWFETGTPTFLIKLIQNNNYFLPNLSSLVVDERLLNSFDIENLDLEVILYQSGYLTIDRVETLGVQNLYYLKIPNLEVQSSLNDNIANLFQKHTSEKTNIQIQIQKAFMKNDLEALHKSFLSIFASIPYNNYTNNSIQIYEGFYSSVIYVYLQSLGLDITAEDVTNKGRIDLSIKMNNTIYILEFKVDGNKGEALKQIKEKKYHEKYLNENKTIYLLGIEFDSIKKNICDFNWEKIDI